MSLLCYLERDYYTNMHVKTIFPFRNKSKARVLDIKELTGEQVFFIYDHTVLQKEEDDLKDAILYFHPSSVVVDTQCALCGQLMGMVAFFKHFGSPSSIIRLRHNKFAVKHTGPYTLALGGQNSDPNGLLVQQLDALSQIFIFYHRSIDVVHKPVSYKRGSSLQPIWDYYLANIRQYGDVLASTFQTIPWLDVPKTSPTVYLRASYLLQTCQRIDGVRAGCLFFKNRVLCSQLQTDITSKLLVLRAQQNHLPCQPLNADFQLPAGVRILRIFLTKDEVKRLSPARRCERQSSTCSSETSGISSTTNTSSGTSTSTSGSTETSSHEPGTMTDSTQEPSSAKVSDHSLVLDNEYSISEHSLSNIPELRTLEGSPRISQGSPRISHKNRSESLLVIVDISGDELTYHEEVLSKTRGNMVESDHNDNVTSIDSNKSDGCLGDIGCNNHDSCHKQSCKDSLTVSKLKTYNESLMKISNFVSESQTIDKISAVNCTNALNNAVSSKLEDETTISESVGSDTESCDARQGTTSSVPTLEDSEDILEARLEEVPADFVSDDEQTTPASCQESADTSAPVPDTTTSVPDVCNTGHVKHSLMNSSPSNNTSVREHLPVNSKSFNITSAAEYCDKTQCSAQEAILIRQDIKDNGAECDDPGTMHSDSVVESSNSNMNNGNPTSVNSSNSNMNNGNPTSVNFDESASIDDSASSSENVSVSNLSSRRSSSSSIIESQKVKLFQDVKRMMSQTSVLQTYDSALKDVHKIMNLSAQGDNVEGDNDEMRKRINSSGKAEMDLIRARINSMSPSAKIRRPGMMYRTRHNSGGSHKETSLFRSVSCSKADKLQLRPASPSPISAFLLASNSSLTSKSSTESDIGDKGSDYLLPFEIKSPSDTSKSISIDSSKISAGITNVKMDDSKPGKHTQRSVSNIESLDKYNSGTVDSLDNTVDSVEQSKGVEQTLSESSHTKTRRTVSFKDPEFDADVPLRGSFRKKKKVPTATLR